MKNYGFILIFFVLLLSLIGAVGASDLNLEDNQLGEGGAGPMIPLDDEDDYIISDSVDSDPIDVGVGTKEIYVDCTGDDSNRGTKESPYASISKAFSDVNMSNTTIYIGEGTFLLDGGVNQGDNCLFINLNHDSNCGNLKFIGSGVNKTVLDGHSVFYFAKICRYSSVLIKDITFKNCKNVDGGTIYNKGNLTIDNCVFENSYANNNGGAIRTDSRNDGRVRVISLLYISNSKFIHSSSINGGGIYSKFSNLYLRNNTFVNTVISQNSGSGVAVYSKQSKAYLINNEFINLTGINDASLYFYSKDNNESNIINNKFIDCSIESKTYSIVNLAKGNFVFINNTFINSTNSIGNIYCLGTMSPLNFNMDDAIITLSDDDAKNGLKININNITDDNGNLVELKSIGIYLINGENIIYRDSNISDGAIVLTFEDLPENGLYNLSFKNGNIICEVLTKVNVSLTNEPVELWVSPRGLDSNNGTRDSPFATIQHAIDVGFEKSFNVIVHLLNGTYTKKGNVGLTIANLGNLQIIGEYNETIIDGESTTCFLDVSTTNVVISNLKFINGSGYSYSGFLIDGGNKLSLEECIFDNNIASYIITGVTKIDKIVFKNNLGRISLSNCNISNSIFKDNTPRGDFLIVDNVTVENCRFINNIVRYGVISGSFVSKNNYYADNYGMYGGAVYLTADAQFINDTFTNNSATNGGGAVASGSDYHQPEGHYLFNPLLTFENCSFINNSAPIGGAVATQFEEYRNEGYFTLKDTFLYIFENCIFINNSATKGGAVSLKIGEFSNCSFNNNLADYGGAFYLVPYIEISGDEISGNGTIDSLDLNNVVFENNVAKLNGHDIYLENPIVGHNDVESTPAYGIALNITFNNLNASTTIFNLSANIYGPYGAIVGANYLTFELNGTEIGEANVLNSVATFICNGLDDGEYILSGTTELPNHKNVVNPAIIFVKLENILESIDVWVSVDGSDENGDGSQENPFKSISKAINKYANNCLNIRVYIGEGTFNGNLNTCLNMISKESITLIGAGRDKTIIDGGNRDYFARITGDNNKVTFYSLTIQNMLPINVFNIVNSDFSSRGLQIYLLQELDSPITVGAGANLYLNNVNINNCHGGKAIIENNGNLVIDNSVFKNNGIVSSAIIYGGNVTVNHVLFENNFGSDSLIDAKSRIYNSDIKNAFNVYVDYSSNYHYPYSLIKGDAVVENTKILNNGDNSSLKELGCNIETDSLYPALSFSLNSNSDNFLVKNISIVNAFDVSLFRYVLTLFGQSYYMKAIHAEVYNSTFDNLEYLWNVNTYLAISISFDGCLFVNISKIAYSPNCGEDSYFYISNSVFMDSGAIIDMVNNRDCDDHIFTFENNYWGSNDRPIINFINSGKAKSFEPRTWIILTEVDGSLVFMSSNGENITGYGGGLPAKISYVLDDGGEVVPVLNIAGTGYKLSVDESNNIVLNTNDPLKNIVPVFPVSETIFANDSTVLVNDGPKFTARFTNKLGDALVNTTVTCIVQDKPINAITDVNGVALFDVDLGLGVYNMTVVNSVTGQSVFKTISVVTNDTIVADDFNVVFGDGSKYQVKFTDNFGRALVNCDVCILIDGNVVKSVCDVNGVALFKIDLDAGSYMINITNPVTSQNVAKKVFVSQFPSKLIVANVNMVYKSPKALVATLTDLNGNPLVGRTVSIIVNGKPYNRITNEVGKVALTVNLGSKTYPVTIKFAGDINYLKSSATAKIVVKKATPKLTANKATLKAKTKTKKYTVVLKDNKNKVISKAKVALKIKGKTYKATTNTKGKATFKITKFTKKGKFTAVVSYSGNSNFNAVNKKVKITIK